jgi:hypothetical protein
VIDRYPPPRPPPVSAPPPPPTSSTSTRPAWLFVIDPDPVNWTHVLPDTRGNRGGYQWSRLRMRGFWEALTLWQGCQVLVPSFTRVADSSGARTGGPG